MPIKVAFYATGTAPFFLKFCQKLCYHKKKCWYEHEAQKIMLPSFCFVCVCVCVCFFFFFDTNANTWHQSYNASTVLIIRNLIEGQKNHIIFCQFSSKNIWMIGGNLGTTGSGLPVARPQVRLPNTWTHLDTQMPYFMLQSRPKQARKC